MFSDICAIDDVGCLHLLRKTKWSANIAKCQLEDNSPFPPSPRLRGIEADQGMSHTD